MKLEILARRGFFIYLDKAACPIYHDKVLKIIYGGKYY